MFKNRLKSHQVSYKLRFLGFFLKFPIKILFLKSHIFANIKNSRREMRFYKWIFAKKCKHVPKNRLTFLKFGESVSIFWISWFTKVGPQKYMRQHLKMLHFQLHERMRRLTLIKNIDFKFAQPSFNIKEYHRKMERSDGVANFHNPCLDSNLLFTQF